MAWRLIVSPLTRQVAAHLFYIAEFSFVTTDPPFAAPIAMEAAENSRVCDYPSTT
jgi:hypothetical protein